MLIETHNQSLLRWWLCKQLDLVVTDHFTAMGRLDPRTGDILGVVGYDGWNGTACEMHMAGSPGWLSRDFIWAAFDYPFNQANCKVVIGKVPSGNVEALDIDRRLGFKTECILEGGHPDGALHILSLRKEDCKWLNRGRHGKEIHAQAPARTGLRSPCEATS